MNMTRPVIAAIAVIAIVIASSAAYTSFVANDGQGNEECYGIIGAMDEEVAHLIDTMEDDRVETLSGMGFHIGKLCGKNVIVVKSGMGKVNAAMCAQTLITKYGATAVINTGVAGTLSPDVGIGDIVISEETVQHDYEVIELGFDPGFIPNVGVLAIPADENLRTKAADIIKMQRPDIDVFQGRICTGDAFISGDEMGPIVAQFGGLCCEMEGGAIAQVCHLNNVPYVVVRCISDNVSGEGPADYEKFEKELAELCAQMIVELMKEL